MTWQLTSQNIINSHELYPGIKRILEQHNTRKIPFAFTEALTLKEILELEYFNDVEKLSRGEMRFLGRKVAQICEYLTESTIYRKSSGQPKYTPEKYPIIIAVFEQFLDENYYQKLDLPECG